MHTRAIAVLIIAACLPLTACSSTTTDKPATKPEASEAKAPAPREKQATAGLDAEAVAGQLKKMIPSMKIGTVFTEQSDPNHLLGRPGGYLSKVAFSDSRVPAKDVEFEDKYSAVRGGSIEVFDTAAAATKRRDYIQRIAKGMPAAAEYDYVQGPVLVRVSKILPPAQAGQYEKAVADIG